MVEGTNIPLLENNGKLGDMGRDFVQLEFELNNRNGSAAAAERKYSNQNEEMHRFMKLEFDKSCYLSDGKRQIDYVLAYEEDLCVLNESEIKEMEESEAENSEESSNKSQKSEESLSEKRRRRRTIYEDNLEKMGLRLERVDISPLLGRTRFILIHAPFHVLEKQAQIMGVKLPVKKSDVYLEDRSYLPGCLDSMLAHLKLFEFDDATKKLLQESDYFTAPYSHDRLKDFVNWDRPDILFPNSERSRMVYDLLTRAHYDDPRHRSEGKHFGIERLLGSYTYNAAYCLHQELRERIPPGQEISQREILRKYWSSFGNILKYQPLDCVKRYFGTKIAFYFAWLGYYTRSLYIPALIGLVTVAFSIFMITEDVVSNDICGSDGIGATEFLCPQCENYCDFQRLNNSCVYAKVSYLFDNSATVIFAAMMSIWATLFLEGWKRYHAEIAWKWGLLDIVVEEDTVRPDFQFRVKTKRFNPVTQSEEPYLSGKKKFLNFFTSGISVLFFLCLVLAVVFGMVVYRVVVMRLLAVVTPISTFIFLLDNPNVDSYAFLIVSMSAATINLIIILCMNMVYNRLALCLTRWECPRTQAEFDNSYTFKVFLFQFVNYYSSLFYIAFFKGLLSQLPGTRDIDGNVKIGGYRLEGCDAAGCFAELVIQLSIIMCGKQFFSAMIEYAYPNVMSLLRKWQLRVPVVVESAEQRKERIREENEKKTGHSMKRWEADYYLNPTYDQFLFDEYLEMVLQFGFVTLFVAAFPLAPFFALLNNVIEIRIDADKFLSKTQRPMPAQARNIGVWMMILDVISKASVTINALVIAFTSDFVPKMLYWYDKGTMIGYVDSSLSYFDATEFSFAKSQFTNVTQCRFRGYRRTPCSLGPLHDGEICDDNLGLSYEWWRVFAARLLFVVVFEHIVFVIKIVVEYLIPDIPTRIFVQQQREKYLLRKALIGDLSGSGTGRSPQESAAFADHEDNAFQPGSFDQPVNGPPFHNTIAPLPRKNTAESMDSFVTCLPQNGSVLTLNNPSS